MNEARMADAESLGLEAEKVAALLQRVQQETGLGLEALAQRFGRNPSWVSRRLGLVEALPEAVQEQVRCGAIPSRAALRCLVPLARANPAQCCELVAGIAGAELSVRAIERLYVAWREGDGAQRARVVSHPLLYLRAEQAQREAEPPDPRAPTSVEATLQDIDVAGALCRRVRRPSRRLPQTDGPNRQRTSEIRSIDWKTGMMWSAWGRLSEK